ncbi:MAG: hypothetical protein KAW89_08020 [Armatimonadetes bacterium]|nr:hypothetical protein [Armatimonadota bacterium]
MNEKVRIVYKKVKEIARAQDTINYSKLASLIGLDMSEPPERTRIGEILGEISRYEHEEGRPMLSAVVVHAADGFPGKGFFNLARELGVYVGPDDVFFCRELEKVYEKSQEA